MKRFIIATALTLAAASSAMATSTQTTLPGTLQFEIRALVPNADLSNLTTAQVAQFYGLFSSSDNSGSGNDTAGQIRAILAQDS